MNISYTALIETILISALLISSQYVVLRAGVFSVASAGLALIGAYTFAILTVTYSVPVVVAFVAAAVAATLAATVLGLLISRLRGTYQAIATLAFVLVIQQLALFAEPLTGGAFGILGIPLWATVEVLLPLFVVGLVILALLDRSLIGRQQSAVRMEESAAASVGIDVARVRLGAQAIAGAFAGVAGACLAGNQYAIDPGSFGFQMVVTALAGAIIGGFRWFIGPLVGALIVQSLPILLGGFAEYQAVVTAALTLVVLAVAPQGLTSLTFRRGSESEEPSRVESAPVDPPPGSDAEPSRGGALVVEDVARSFGGVAAVDGANFRMERGEIFGLIGPNGAGKSTLLNLIAGVLRLDRGRITIGDVRVDQLRPHEVSRAGIARTFQTVKLFDEMTVFENVLVASASAPGLRKSPSDRKHEVEEILRRTGIAHLAQRHAGTLPYTDQRRAEVARALATGPKTLLLDEPAAGMTSPEADDLGDLIRQISAEGVSVLVVDHNVSWILGLCDHIVVQAGGVPIASGDAEAIKSDARVKEAYLG